MARLVIRGGMVVDGTGDAPRPAEVLVVDGRIAEVDAKVDASGAEELDASGALRDARLHRQPHASGSIVVLGSCGATRCRSTE